MNPLLLFWLVLKAAVLTPGGMANVPLLHADLVARGAVSEAVFAEAIAVGQTSPGPNGLWVISLGYLMGGIAGALTALVAISIPPFFVLAIDRVYGRIRHHASVQSALRMVGLALAGTFFAVLVEMASATSHDRRTLVVTAAAAPLAFSKKIPLIAILIAAALAGSWLLRPS